MAFNTTEDVIKYIKDEGIEFLDVRFTDVPGQEQHFSIPASEFTEDVAEEGLAFDGSSIVGFTSIDESDMNLLPDVTTAMVDPFRKAHEPPAGRDNRHGGPLPQSKNPQHEVLRSRPLHP